jgi:hypothetical protein
MCATFRGAETEIDERALRIENHWMRTSLQLNFLQRVWQGLDEEHCKIQKQVLQVLLGKLTTAISKLESFLEVKSDHPGREPTLRAWSAGVKKWKYVLLKENLDKTIEELELWQKTFDPSWFLILMATNTHVDAELSGNNGPFLKSTHSLRNALRGGKDAGNTPIFLPVDDLRSAQILDVPFSSLQIAQRMGSSKWLILDTISCSLHGNTQHLTKNVRDLARKMSYSDPTQFGLLNCRGVVKQVDPLSSSPTMFTFVFKMPEGMSEPQSLRASLLYGATDHSLSDRFGIAKDIAKSTSFIHTLGFVHKNIRPETILIMKNGVSALGSPFLVGFENFRNAEGMTSRSSDASWERDLYRHPRRQGSVPEADYIMQHDIYSLGVSLLEIGMWESFVTYNQRGACPATASSLGPLSERIFNGGPSSVKDHLVSLSQSILPSRMGSRYSKIVETCLTCLDENNTDFGDEREFQDEDGVLVGVRYVEKVSHSPS